jgi:adenylosuccinate lyase
VIKIERKKYNNPLIVRYASDEMSYIFSDENKFSNWRKLWVALAESQRQLGLNITEEQINELKDNIYNIDFDLASKKEKEFRHDVMAHVHTYGTQCKKAMPIIHLGATSAFVGDNTDIILLKEASVLIKKKLAKLMKEISKFSIEYCETPTLGYTHFQPAQLTTVGKRATLWLQDLYYDYLDLEYEIENLKLRGAKGTTGTQASYMKLFDDDEEKVKELDYLVAKKMGFEEVYDVTGQTYPRKVDYKILSKLNGIAQSLHKMTNDIRLLQNFKEIEEPFGKKQIGSSAMAYKRNPMRSERIASLSRYIINITGSTSDTAATQWFERTLDDSANRRLTIPESFLACDASIDIATNIFQGIIVNKKVIEKHINDELPFMATENIIMELVKKGGDRQELHEQIRVLSMEAAQEVKEKGKENDLIDRIALSEELNITREEIEELLDPIKFIGRSKNQTIEFINKKINPILEKYNFNDEEEIELKV